MMLIVMNGYSGSDAQWWLLTYIILAVVAAILMGIGSAVFTSSLLKKQFTAAVSVVIAVLVFGLAGAILEIVGSVIGIGVAEYVRVNY
jgi:ABC-type transport system involved in multi-copper enzyme maturation permease subunit